MLFYKCKICGGDLEIQEEMSVCECMYCGTKQTLPKMNSEKKANLYDRANHFRRNGEYDKAMSIYEQVLEEDKEDAESYWSLVLCTYGIDYVEEPGSSRRIPTINRAQYTSVLADENYKAALRYADGYQKQIYEEEAALIDGIQKGILEISNKEEPFDVFICYKESDAAGRRTPDSVLANDLYHQLTQEGFKVFYSRITLEDKLGSAYEPYIFAALNSAKVMVVLGTKPEYFKAVWVKNEWSRFLGMMKKGEKKVLIPAYKDMDPYDLPEEFSHLQAQDMSKLGFMQDLIRGIKKLTDKEGKVEERIVSSTSTGSNAQSLVERAFLILEDGDFNKADELCEQALNQDPKNALAYVGKLMVERRVSKQEELSGLTESLAENSYFQKAIRFADDNLKAKLEDYSRKVIENGKDEEYAEALDLLQKGAKHSLGVEAIRMLDIAIGKYESLVGWKDSESKIAECREIRENRIKAIYEEAQLLQKEGESKKISPSEAISKLKEAKEIYNSIAGYMDATTKAFECEDQLDKLYKIMQRKFIRIAVAGVAVAVFLCVLVAYIEARKIYKEAYAAVETKVEAGDYEGAIAAAGEYLEQDDVNELFYDFTKEKIKNGEYEAAIDLLTNNSEYEGAEELINKATYQWANQYLEDGEYENAIEKYKSISGYKDSDTLWQKVTYQWANQCMENEEFENAMKKYKSISGYKDSDTLCQEATYQSANQYLKDGVYENAIVRYKSISGYKDSDALCQEATYQWANQYLEDGEYEIATEKYKIISGYKDSDTLCQEATYQCANQCMRDGEFNTAIEKFNSISGYKDSKELAEYVNEIMKWAIVSDCVLIGVHKDALPNIVEIPEFVTEIGEKAFEGCSNLTKVVFVECVYIGGYAFKDCSSLTEIVSIGGGRSYSVDAFEGTPLEEEDKLNAAWRDE